MSKKITKLETNEIEGYEDEIPKYKIVLLGDSNVGKTSLIVRYCSGAFKSEYISTVGIDTQIKYIKYNNKKIGLEIWDTAGQERFKSLTRSCYQGADGIILMYDLTQKKTFSNIKIWYNNIRDSINIKKVAIIIVGNKLDMEDKIQVEGEVSDKFFKKENLYSIQTSCKNDINVDEVFEFLVEKIVKKNNYKNQNGRSSKLTSFSVSRKNKCCH